MYWIFRSGWLSRGRRNSMEHLPYCAFVTSSPCPFWCFYTCWGQRKEVIGLGLPCDCFYMAKTGIKWIWGIAFEGKSKWGCWNKGDMQPERWVWRGREWSGVSPWPPGGLVVREGTQPPVTILVLQLWPSILVPCPSLEPGSLVMALPCDGETVFGWQECWTHCGTPWWTCTLGESTDGNLSRFLRRSEGASQQIILGWDSAGEREKEKKDSLLFTSF